ncbi:hypothetical protein H5410_005308 [Solanum commersonii]|uniref:Uncharacterized protein n=1 Tax=Solanum commersonii TaxID=4109 RepID=A0A9J6A6W2_SOLCO|nr:hypothetical protein H5410_005308 [Solanum commersonii]
MTVFIWIDVEQSVFNCRVGMRVDEIVNADSFLNNTFGFEIYVQLNKTILKFMLHAWMVDEVRQIFILDAYYTKGIR